MTVGIYALHWEEKDLIYVGQSQNINRRFSEHKRLMNNRSHTNYKVQNAFNLYGLPELVVLEECNIEQCNELEILWTKEFDSLNSLNTIEAGQVGYGTNSNASKYSKLQILLTFRLLYTTKLSYQDIGRLTNTNKSLASDIFNGASHTWLKDKYSYLYCKMIVNKRLTNIGKDLKYDKSPIIMVSPLGIEFTVINIRDFCRSNNLINTCLGEVIRGKRKHHKGWKLKNN